LWLRQSTTQFWRPQVALAWSSLCPGVWSAWARPPIVWWPDAPADQTVMVHLVSKCHASNWDELRIQVKPGRGGSADSTVPGVAAAPVHPTRDSPRITNTSAWVCTRWCDPGCQLHWITHAQQTGPAGSTCLERRPHQHVIAHEPPHEHLGAPDCVWLAVSYAGSPCATQQPGQPGRGGSTDSTCLGWRPVHPTCD
jgi:hypothetical protein